VKLKKPTLGRPRDKAFHAGNKNYKGQADIIFKAMRR